MNTTVYAYDLVEDKAFAAASDLARGDVMEMEGLLHRQLARFLEFSGHALYFPTEHAPDAPLLLPRERRLLLPLLWGGKALGVFMLHGVRVRQADRLLPTLPALTALCLENLARTKAARTDAVTGFLTEPALLARMEAEAENVRAHLDDPARFAGRPAPLHRLCMGIVLIRFCNGDEVADQAGFSFHDDMLRQLVRACKEALPSDVPAARVSPHELALLLPAGGRGACDKLARAVLARMENVRMAVPLTQQPVRPLLSAGHALYPQDMQGPELVLPMFEQARRLMARARLAAETAAAGRDGTDVRSPVTAFARILQDGGKVLESLAMGRMRINLGRRAKAREGQRFSVLEKGGPAVERGRYKGEIVLLRVGENDAVAEMLHLADAACLPEAGDELTLLGGALLADPADAADFSGSADVSDAADFAALPGLSDVADPADSPDLANVTNPADTVGSAALADAANFVALPGLPDPVDSPGLADSVDLGSLTDLTSATSAVLTQPVDDLLGHGDFLNRLAVSREQCRRFVLAVLRLAPAGKAPGAESTDASGASSGMASEREAAQALAVAARIHKELFAEASLSPAERSFGGLYGSNSLIFFHSGRDAAALLPEYIRLCQDLPRHGLHGTVGLAGYPLLQFRKAEMQECALKALEYASLLPEPKAGICNSPALNISADRRYSLGDVFGAVDEYKLALLLDKGNATAWNSLGVCMAALGRGHEARRHFLEALKRKPEPAVGEQVYYNLGTVCQSLGERRAAARYYRLCIGLCPEHLFAHIRLGRICEEGGRRSEARRFYEKAAAIEDKGSNGPSLARRHLARVAARQRRGGEARELLHEALLRNPHDAASMLLLAKLYLDAKEDPAVAEILARKSASLHGNVESWQVLARALRALDREDEACMAEARALGA